MEKWEKSNVREALGIINKVMKILTSSSKSDLTSMLMSAAGTMVIGGHNMTVAYTFMDDYLVKLKGVVHEVAEGLMKAAEVTKALCGVNSKDVAKWLAAVEKTGAIVGDKPYQISHDGKADGVHKDISVAKEGLLKATMTALNISEVAARAHPLYQFGARLILSVHQIQAEDDQENWEKQLTGSMKGELNRGIGLQSQGLTQLAMETGMSAAGGSWSKEQDGLKRAELEGLTDLTPEQEETLSEIKGREYAELDYRARAGKELSEEDKAKLGTYQQRDSAARAQQKAEYDAYIQSKADEHHAKAAQAAAEGRAKDAAIAEAQRQREAEAAKKPEPEPGTLPAVASAKAPNGVDSMGGQSEPSYRRRR